MTDQTLSVFVNGLTVQAEIGIYAHEHHQPQPLVLDVELGLDGSMIAPEHISDTFNYEKIVEAAKALARGGHILLIETFAARLADQLMADIRVCSVRIRIEKPLALQPDARAAGCQLFIRRAA